MNKHVSLLDDRAAFAAMVLRVPSWTPYLCRLIELIFILFVSSAFLASGITDITKIAPWPVVSHIRPETMTVPGLPQVVTATLH